MHDNIREIHVSVRARKDDSGKPAAAPIYFNGKPVPKGVYTATDLPTGWKWERLVAAALRNEGHGVAVFYRDDKKKPAAKEEVKDNG